jgi:hypothetical protein
MDSLIINFRRVHEMHRSILVVVRFTHPTILNCVRASTHHTSINEKLLTFFYPGNYAKELVDFQAGAANQGAVDIGLPQ